MARFITKLFDDVSYCSLIEEWLNDLRDCGYFVRIENVTITRGDRIFIIVFCYVPSIQPKTPEDVSQPEPYQEPVIDTE